MIHFSFGKILPDGLVTFAYSYGYCSVCQIAVRTSMVIAHFYKYQLYFIEKYLIIILSDLERFEASANNMQEEKSNGGNYLWRKRKRKDKTFAG